MVGVRVFLIFVLSFLFFSAPLYALMPPSDEIREEETLSSKAREQIEEIRREKESLSESVLPLREQRKKNLHPFIYKAKETDANILEAFSFDTEAIPTRYTVKGFTPVVSRSDLSKPDQALGQGLTSKLIPNLIFFALIIIAFLAGYFITRPKTK